MYTSELCIFKGNSACTCERFRKVNVHEFMQAVNIIICSYIRFVYVLHIGI